MTQRLPPHRRGAEATDTDNSGGEVVSVSGSEDEKLIIYDRTEHGQIDIEEKRDREERDKRERRRR